MRSLRAFVARVGLSIVAAFLFSSGVVLAQDQPDKTSDAVYEAGNGVTAPKLVHASNTEFPSQHVGRKSMVS
jgi:hypothetical protein